MSSDVCRRVFSALLAVLLLTAFASCGDGYGNPGRTDGTDTPGAGDGTSDSIAGTAPAGDMFSDRDLEVGYDESTASVIELSDSGITGGDGQTGEKGPQGGGKFPGGDAPGFPGGDMTPPDEGGMPDGMTPPDPDDRVPPDGNIPGGAM